ncbi:MAG: Uma2 family endonuclease [Saprospiraceae bacterium]
MNDNYVKEILNQPNAQLIINKVKDELIAEEQKRNAFYEWIDEDTKAEFINGRIDLHSPVKKEHTDVTKYLLMLLQPFVAINQLGYIGFEKTMIRLTRNDYEPDVCFFKKEKAKDFKVGQMLYPTPDFVVEILSSNVERDRVTKFIDYQEHGVSEYWIIHPQNKVVEQYLLKNSKYELELKAKEGHIYCQAVEGFTIAVASIFNETDNLKMLIEILSKNNKQ